MATNKILEQLKNKLPEDGGDGIIVDVSFSPQSIATTGTRATAENSVPADVVVIDADNEDAIVNFMIPRDYDEASDYLRVDLLVAYVSGTSIALQAATVSRGNASSIYADESNFSTVTATTINAAFSIGLVSANLDGLTWLTGDSLAVNFIASGLSSSGVAHIVGARITYKSLIVASNHSDR